MSNSGQIRLRCLFGGSHEVRADALCYDLAMGQEGDVVENM